MTRSIVFSHKLHNLYISFLIFYLLIREQTLKTLHINYICIKKVAINIYIYVYNSLAVHNAQVTS